MGMSRTIACAAIAAVGMMVMGCETGSPLEQMSSAAEEQAAPADEWGAAPAAEPSLAKAGTMATPYRLFYWSGVMRSGAANTYCGFDVLRPNVYRMTVSAYDSVFCVRNNGEVSRGIMGSGDDVLPEWNALQLMAIDVAAAKDGLAKTELYVLDENGNHWRRKVGGPYPVWFQKQPPVAPKNCTRITVDKKGNPWVISGNAVYLVNYSIQTVQRVIPADTIIDAENIQVSLLHDLDATDGGVVVAFTDTQGKKRVLFIAGTWATNGVFTKTSIGTFGGVLTGMTVLRGVAMSTTGGGLNYCYVATPEGLFRYVPGSTSFTRYENCGPYWDVSCDH
jgi:hypothetical protein